MKDRSDVSPFIPAVPSLATVQYMTDNSANFPFHLRQNTQKYDFREDSIASCNFLCSYCRKTRHKFKH